ncbi:ParB-like nuclease domain-containing protein [Vibrio sp. SCSIO 43153]|uniref:IbrB-like domain-containing protein n=1 Tax=Vibrio sp. SCSIO 43153 TaxID=2819098 RepID=UPI0020760F2A|nr:ParB/RepB/Spo0J family partition protein [Vibrio sp. SCSIO 43153]USD52566.1 ParB-like nuclease domain-containing protein [Vibrio sp. SCSIO 43153]
MKYEDLKVILEKLLSEVNKSKLQLKDRVKLFNLLSELSSDLLPFDDPILSVKLMSVDKLKDNDYNPNKVSSPEFRLLKHSIIKDGFTMPIVTNQSHQSGDYIIVDGYHRSKLLRDDKEINGLHLGYAPVVIMNKSIEERMSSSVRHNTARGVHQVELTAKLISKLKERQWTNKEIGIELGMDMDEVLRMQQVTGLAAAFKNNDFSEAWK